MCSVYRRQPAGARAIRMRYRDGALSERARVRRHLLAWLIGDRDPAGLVINGRLVADEIERLLPIEDQGAPRTDAAGKAALYAPRNDDPPHP